MLCCSHGFPILSFTLRFYNPSLAASLPGYILCPYRAIVDNL